MAEKEDVGGVKFGVEADTSSLAAGSARLDQFEKALRRMAQAYEAQQKAQARATFDSVKAAKHQADVDAIIRKSYRGRKQLTEAEAAAAKKSKEIAIALRDLGSAATLVYGPLNALGGRITAMSNVALRGVSNMAILTTAIGGLVLASTLATGVLINTASSFQKMEATLTAVGPSAQYTALTMSYLIKTSRDLKVPVLELTQQYSLLAAAARGTALEGGITDKTFKAIATSARVLNISVQDMEGVFRALIQMISKGKVYAEELNQQFGERLPGALQAAAAAMGRTTEQFLKDVSLGLVKPAEFIPLVADKLQELYGKGLPAALKTARAAQDDLNNEFALLAYYIDRSTSITGGYAAVLTAFASTLRVVSGNLNSVVGAFVGSSAAALTWLATTKASTTAARSLTAALLPLRAILVSTGAVATATGRAFLFGGSVAGLSAAVKNLGTVLRAVGVAAFASALSKIGAVAARLLPYLTRLAATVGALYIVYRVWTRYVDIAAEAQSNLADQAQNYVTSSEKEKKALVDEAKELQAAMQERMKAVEAMIEFNKEQQRSGTLSTWVGRLGDYLTGLIKDTPLIRLQQESADLNAELDILKGALEKLALSINKVDEETGGLSKAFRDALDDAGELARELKDVQKGLDAAAKGEYNLAEAYSEFAKAKALVGKLPAAELGQFADKLEELTNISTDKGADPSARIGTILTQIEDKKKELEKALKTPDTIKELADERQELLDRLADTSSKKGLKKGAAEADISKQLRELNNKLKKETNLSNEEISSILSDREKLLRQVSEAELKFYGEGNKGRGKDNLVERLDLEIVQTERLRDATRQGAAQLRIFEKSLEIDDKVEQYGLKLKQAGVSTEQAASLTGKYKQALSELNAAQQQIGKAEYTREIDQLHRLIEVADEGEGGFRRLNKEFSREEEIRNFREGLASFVPTLNELNTLTDEFVKSLDAVSRAEDDLVIKDMQQQIDDFYALTEAAYKGQQAFSDLKEAISLRDDLKGFTDKTRSLLGNSAEANALIDSYRKGHEVFVQAEKDLETNKEVLEAYGGAARDLFEGLGDSVLNFGDQSASALEQFQGLFRNFISDIIKETLRLTVINKVMNSLFGSKLPTADLGSLFGKSSPTVTPGTGVSTTSTGAPAGGLVDLAHSGGVAGATNFTKRWDTGSWVNVPRFHNGRIKSDEMRAIIRKKESVVTPEQMNSLLRGRDTVVSPITKVFINNNTDSRVRARTNNKGDTIVDVDTVLASQIVSGGSTLNSAVRLATGGRTPLRNR